VAIIKEIKRLRGMRHLVFGSEKRTASQERSGLRFRGVDLGVRTRGLNRPKTIRKGHSNPILLKADR